MSQILDTAGDVKAKAHISIRELGDTRLDHFTVTDCATGQSLVGSSVTDVLVEISPAGLNTWSTLSGASFDLSPYNGTDQDFDLRFTDSRGAQNRERVLFSITLAT